MSQPIGADEGRDGVIARGSAFYGKVFDGDNFRLDVPVGRLGTFFTGNIGPTGIVMIGGERLGGEELKEAKHDAAFIALANQDTRYRTAGGLWVPVGSELKDGRQAILTADLGLVLPRLLGRVGITVTSWRARREL